MPFSPKTMENFSSGHHKIEEELPIFPQKPSKRWKKSRWPPSESIYFFFKKSKSFMPTRGIFTCSQSIRPSVSIQLLRLVDGLE